MRPLLQPGDGEPPELTRDHVQAVHRAVGLLTAFHGDEQFLSLAAQIMRRVLVDHARQRGAQRRGDGAKKVSMHDTQAAFEVEAVQALDSLDDDRVDVLAIDAALTRLQQIDAPQGRIVELRYFGGLTLEETASVTGISLASVKREWAMARAWLRRELASLESPES